MTHDEWIEAFAARFKWHVRGLCALAVTEMVEAFPELRRVCGVVTDTLGAHQHHWCMRPDGVIVDPTAAQFVGAVTYEEVDPDAPETIARFPSGRCWECGSDLYFGKDNSKHFCDRECEDMYVRSLNLL